MLQSFTKKLWDGISTSPKFFKKNSVINYKRWKFAINSFKKHSNGWSLGQVSKIKKKLKLIQTWYFSAAINVFLIFLQKPSQPPLSFMLLHFFHFNSFINGRINQIQVQILFIWAFNLLVIYCCVCCFNFFIIMSVIMVLSGCLKWCLGLLVVPLKGVESEGEKDAVINWFGFLSWVIDCSDQLNIVLFFLPPSP